MIEYVIQQTIKRIQHMERCLDEVTIAFERDPVSILKDRSIHRKFLELVDYYDHGLWLRDFERDERGELPIDLKRGVLSEDTLYNLVSDVTASIREYRGVKADMMNGVKAILFDLDGSLVDSMWIWRDIDIEYLGRFGYDLPDDLQAKIEGMSYKEVAEYMKERFQIPDSIEDMQAEWNSMAWEKYTHKVHLKPGAREFLEMCRSKHILLGIASSNSRELIMACLESNGILDYISCICSGSDGLRGKPAPDIYLAVAEKLQMKPKDCLVFEDIVPGIMAGKNAGMKVCAVDDLYSAHQEEAKRSCADYYIDHFYEVLGSF